MQLHQLSSPVKKKTRRVGRGGKRGTFSGHGSKGQKARAGARIRPGFRGGDNPIWKLFPKKRGSTKRVDIKHRSFARHTPKPIAINLELIEKIYVAGDTVSPKTLKRRGAISSTRFGVKILSDGSLSKKLTFKDVTVSAVAKEKIGQAGGIIG